jgi:hypothetical protein
MDERMGGRKEGQMDRLGVGCVYNRAYVII